MEGFEGKKEEEFMKKKMLKKRKGMVWGGVVMGGRGWGLGEGKGMGGMKEGRCMVSCYLEGGSKVI